MAPTYKQMNAPQRATRKALVGQVAGLLAKRKKKFPGRTGPALIPSKPVTEYPKGATIRMSSAQTPNYYGRKKKGKRKPYYGDAFNIPSLSGDQGA